ncbi:MAG TPA: cytochrome P450 [Pseudomonadales bacterium]|nr:cytochrome P450 [Pseudomonadales bacterium]
MPIFDPAFKADPHPFYAALRRLAGVSRMRLPSGTGVWIVLRYDHARKLLRDPRLSKVPQREDGAAPKHALFNHLLTMDPPSHAVARSVLAPCFSPRVLRAFEPRVSGLVDALLQRIPCDDEPFDVLTAFAGPLAQSVVCELVGVPDDVRESLARGLDDLDRADFDAPDRVPGITQHLFDTLLGVCNRRASLPPESLLATLCAARDHGSIPPEQVVSLTYLVLAAGRETAANLIANGLLRLLTRPPTWAELARAPQHAGALVEELLRLESPLEMATARYAIADIAIDDTTIRAGDTVFVGLAASNRDPLAFERPDELDLSRTAGSKHLAFGYGIHRCLGAILARIEARIALARLAAHFPSLELAVPAGQLAWKPGLITRGLQNLPVRRGAPGRKTFADLLPG